MGVVRYQQNQRIVHRLGVNYERQREVKIDLKVFGLSSEITVLPFAELEKLWVEQL